MRKSLLSKSTQHHLIEHFIAGRRTRSAGSHSRVKCAKAAFYLHRLLEIIVLELETENEAMFGREIEVDESYFCGKRKGKRGRDAVREIGVLGLLNRGGKVYTKIVSNAFPETLLPIMERKLIPRQYRLFKRLEGL